MDKEKQIEEMTKILCRGDCEKCIQSLCADWYKAEDLYDAGYRKQEWISVEDRLPDELFTSVLIYCPDKDNIYCAYLNARNEWHIFDQGSGLWVLERVTHWMPLPEPPTEKEN